MYGQFQEDGRPENISQLNEPPPESNASPWLYHDLSTNEATSIPNYIDLKSLKPSQYLYWQDILDFENQHKSKKAFDLGDHRTRFKYKEQRIAQASGRLVNTDYYGIIISKMPKGFDSVILAEYIRTYFNLLTIKLSEFEAYDAENKKIWDSKNYISAIMRFNTTFDDLSVFVSAQNPNYWVMTPVTTVFDQEHPLSGHRQFGIVEASRNNKTYWIFYTRALDRTWGVIDVLASGLIFDGADALWKEVLDATAKLISNLEGGATGQTISFSRQIDWISAMGA